AIHRFWQSLGFKMNKILAWFITFNFINITWIFFRAKDFESAMKVLKGMFGMSGYQLHPIFAGKLAFLEKYGVIFHPFDTIHLPLAETLWFIFAFILVLAFKNSMKYLNIKFTINYKFAFFTAFLLILGLLSLNKVSEFLYFNF
ncbi:MBOAT family protein, partial [Aliarcobacter cryaerophilus]|nr:MBOAT family protein [Aliarcobacter cryaerophilus]